jgi:peptidoglycan/LPS O-acetylase OafA/YrhL
MTTLLPVVAPIGATSWIRALLFVDIPAAHPVAWTLFYEVRFYLMISVVILLFRTTRETGFAVWAAGMSAVTWFHIQGVLPWTQFTTTFTTVRLTRNAKPATY